MGKNFENCTIRGPSVITREGKPPSHKGTSEMATVSHVPTLYVEGSPDSVLHEVLPNAVMASGVIHLVGCSYKRVTFSDVGVAGSPEEIAWWRKHCTFSEGSAASQPSLSKVQAENKRLKEGADQLKAQRDGQIGVRCRKLADSLDRLLGEWKQDDLKNPETLREYDKQFKAEAVSVINDLKTFNLWKPKVEDPERLERPENREDVQNLAGYLRWVANGFPI